MEEHHIICSDIQNSHGNLPGYLGYLWGRSHPTADTSNKKPVAEGQRVLKGQLLESDQSASLQHQETSLKNVGPSLHWQTWCKFKAKFKCGI